jgi:hypothetical protein
MVVESAAIRREAPVFAKTVPNKMPKAENHSRQQNLACDGYPECRRPIHQIAPEYDFFHDPARQSGDDTDDFESRNLVLVRTYFG